MAEYDNKAFNAMQNSTKSKADNIAGPSKDFSWGTFHEKGDSLYSVYADKSIPQYDPNFPDVSMFDESGSFTSEYREKRYPNDVITEDGITTERTNIKSTRSPLTERQSYFQKKLRGLAEGMPEGGFGILSNAWEGTYGKDEFMNPKYSKSGKLVSPYKLSKIFQEETGDKSYGEKSEFTKEIYQPWIKKQGLKSKE